MTPNTTIENGVSSTESLDEMTLDHSNVESQEAVTRYVVVNINSNLYGMATDSTVELMSSSMTMVTRVPHSPTFIEGVINHRGTIIPVIDGRALLGFEVRGQEAKQLKVLFASFQDDHENWLNALEISVKENKPFNLATDPSQCSFTTWFNAVIDGSVKECSEELAEPMVNAIVKRFDSPHQRIHAIAEQVLALRDEEDIQQAMDIIEQAREKDLASMGELFELAYTSISRQYESMLVITEYEGRKAAIAVDGVSFVLDCNDDEIEPLPDTADNTEFLSGLVHQSDGSYILIADLANIYSHTCVDRE